MENRRDEELLAEHLAGGPDAFDQLVSRYMDGLYAFFQRYVGNGAAAEDLVQETFLQVHTAAHTFDPGRTFKPWLYTIAANKARDHMRARGRRPVQSLDAVVGDADSPTPSALVEDDGLSAREQLDAEEQIRLVRELVSRMPEHLRMILILGYYQKLPYAEIAEILGIPVGTVKSRLHSAVQHFSQLWQAQDQASAPEK